MNKYTHKAFILGAGLLTSILSMSANSASVCKGLDSDACASNTSCGWVESYTRKDDRVVKAFCRTSTKGKKPLTKIKAPENKKV